LWPKNKSDGLLTVYKPV